MRKRPRDSAHEDALACFVQPRKPRAFARSKTTTAVLVATALLCASASLGAPARARGAQPGSRAIRPGTGAVHVLNAGHRPPLPRIHAPSRSVAKNTEVGTSSITLQAIPSATGSTDPPIATSSLQSATLSIFLTHAVNTSRTRGQPVTGS